MKRYIYLIVRLMPTVLLFASIVNPVVAAEMNIVYSYDKLNRLKSVSYQLPSDSPYIKYQYDELGNITEYWEMDSLSKAVMCLKIATGMSNQVGDLFAIDINSDSKIGIEEAIHEMQMKSGLR